MCIQTTSRKYPEKKQKKMKEKEPSIGWSMVGDVVPKTEEPFDPCGEKCPDCPSDCRVDPCAKTKNKPKKEHK